MEIDQYLWGDHQRSQVFGDTHRCFATPAGHTGVIGVVISKWSFSIHRLHTPEDVFLSLTLLRITRHGTHYRISSSVREIIMGPRWSRTGVALNFVARSSSSACQCCPGPDTQSLSGREGLRRLLCLWRREHCICEASATIRACSGRLLIPLVAHGRCHHGVCRSTDSRRRPLLWRYLTHKFGRIARDRRNRSVRSVQSGERVASGTVRQ